MVCDVGEGTVHRLWEPLADKQHPANGYAGKFSTPYCIAAGFVRGNVGSGRFHRCGGARPGSARARRQGSLPDRPATIRIRRISPATSARCCATAAWSRNASLICAAARNEPLTRADIEEKFVLNARTAAGVGSARRRCSISNKTLFDGPGRCSMPLPSLMPDPLYTLTRFPCRAACSAYAAVSRTEHL